MKRPKWLPRDLQESFYLFEELTEAVTKFKWLAKRFSQEINLTVPDSYVICELTEATRTAFRTSDELQMKVSKAYIRATGDKRNDRNPYNQLLAHKVAMILTNLKQRQVQLIFIMRRQINFCLAAALHSDGFIDDALLLAATYNECIGFSGRYQFGSNAQVCCNSFTSILLPPSRIDIKYILRVISMCRSEQCCLILISSLLATCQIDTNSNGAGSDSETSSIEILRALTSHMTSASPMNDATQSQPSPGPDSATMVFFEKIASTRSPTTCDSSAVSAINANADALERLVSNEENYYAYILLKCLKFCPSAFDAKPTKAEIIKWVNKGTRNLWTQTGGTLEHVVLWWCNTPLACQPVAAAKHLRDWLLNIQFDEAPDTLVSILRCLGETITVHVSSTTWDKQFRLTLVSSSLPIDYKFENDEFYSSKTQLEGTTTTGRLWSELLYTLSTFCNNCDQHSTIPNELPIVEQVAVLHRLDHSIHTMRLWAAAKAKALSTEWSMAMFFKVVQNDVNQCLDQIRVLRMPDLVPPDPIEVEVKVNVALRAKLISEVKVNICKLKLTYSECIEVLAAVCKMLSLATLSLCFPKTAFWQCDKLQEQANDYVSYFLDQIYLPVLHATQVLEILNLVLRIMCEAWLDHIYMKKIKFSREGALNLLRDFDGVSEWIMASSYVLPEHIEILSKHEVLRTCEGVGKILLRKPFEIISMTKPVQQYTPRGQEANDKNMEQETLLPPEMFVPNQQRWLELRARNRKRRIAAKCLCVDQSCVC